MSYNSRMMDQIFSFLHETYTLSREQCQTIMMINDANVAELTEEAKNGLIYEVLHTGKTNVEYKNPRVCFRFSPSEITVEYAGWLPHSI